MQISFNNIIKLKNFSLIILLICFNDTNAQNCLPVATANEYITPLKITEATNYLISKGFTQQEISSEFGSTSNPAIYTSYVAIKFINDYNNIWVLDENNTIVNSSGQQPDAYRCALDAFGIIGIGQMLQGQLTKEAMWTIVKKIAPKVLGPIAAAWAVWDFGMCMGWWGMSEYDIYFGNIVASNNYIKCE